MANVLMVYGVREPTNVLLDGFLTNMSESYDLTLRSSLVQQITPDDIKWCDILMCVRPQAGLIASVARIAKKCGKMVIAFIDDNFLEIKDFKLRRYFQWKALTDTLQQTDLVMSSNEKLADRMCAEGNIARKACINTTMEADEMHPYTKAAASGTINIAYYASDGSTEPFDAYIKPILPVLWEQYGDKIHWTFFSVHPDVQMYAPDCVTYHKSMSLEAFRETLRTGGFHVGLAPLMDSEFCGCKYINKFIEYTKAGIPCIYSNVPPYDTFIRDGKTGILAENTQAAWIEAFEKMADSAVREACIQGAQQQICDEFSEKKIFQKLAQDVPELVAFKAPQSKAPGRYALVWPHIQETWRKVADPLVRIYARWKLEGFMSVCKWTWNQYICRERRD